MKTMILIAAAAGTLFLASCGSNCPSGANTSDPSCPGYNSYNQGTYSYGGSPNGGGYNPQQYDPNAGSYGQNGNPYNQQQPYGGGGGYYGQ